MTDVEGLPLAGSDFSVSLPDAVVATAIPSFDSESEEALSLRYGRRTKAQDELTFEFTRDPALLHQYFELYQKECRVVPQLLAVEEEYNKKGYILIIRQGNLCIGGARLSVRTPRQPKPLPMEIGEFRLEDYFSHLKHKEMRYGELSRLILLPEYRDGYFVSQLLRHMHRKGVALGLDMVFAAAPLTNLRSYKKNAFAIGLKQSKIYTDIIVPPYPGFEEVKDYLLSIDIDKSADEEMEFRPENSEVLAEE